MMILAEMVRLSQQKQALNPMKIWADLMQQELVQGRPREQAKL
jgi:hypothetical protein